MEVPGRKYKDITGASEPGEEHLCEPCLDLGQKLLAAGFCVDCNDFLCRKCYKHHHKPRVYRDHVLQDEKAMPKVKPEKLSTKVADNADMCSKHKGEIIKFYCCSDRQLGCGSCMITIHRRCEELISIEEEYEKIEKEITKFDAQLNSQFQTKEQNSVVIETNHSQAVKDIKHFLTDIKVFFETLDDKMISEADKIKDNDEKKMKSISATCLTLRNDLQTLTSDLAKLHQTQQNGQLFAMMEGAKAQMKTISKDIDEINIENKVHVYSFVPEIELKATMGNLKALGKLASMTESNKGNETNIFNTSEEDIKKEDGEANPVQTISKPSQRMQSESKVQAARKIKPLLFQPRQASHCAHINVTSSDEKEQYITGLTLLPDDHLILTDYANNKVKLVSVVQEKLISELKLKSRPHDITAINDNQVATTIPDANQIQMLYISNQKLSLGQTIKVKGECHGIVHNEGTLIVTFIEPAKIVVISMSGTVLRVIDKGTNVESLFEQPKYVALNLDKTHVYISDYKNHSVTCMTLDGEVKGIYEEDGIYEGEGYDEPCGVTVDKSGSVYVVGGGYIHPYIYQISGDCSQGQELMVHEQSLWGPGSIAYCPKEDKLYVGNRENTIFVYQLK